VYGKYAPSLPCGQAQNAITTLPIFVGEFSLQSKLANDLASRQAMYQVRRSDPHLLSLTSQQ